MAEEKRSLKKSWIRRGLERVGGGLADYAFMGFTDFDKRGSANYQ